MLPLHRGAPSRPGLMDPDRKSQPMPEVLSPSASMHSLQMPSPLGIPVGYDEPDADHSAHDGKDLRDHLGLNPPG